MAGIIDLPTLVQKVRLDADTATGEKDAKNAVSRLGNTLTKVGKGLTAAVTVPIVGLAIAGVKAASDLNESVSKTDVVFGAAAAGVHKFASTAATDLGISRQAAEEGANTFGNLFRALGTGQEPAAQMSTSLVKMASDLASFNNANPEDVLLAMRSGLLGEAEPMRQFGVSLSATRIEAEALSSGLVKATGDSTKIAAASLAVEKASQAAAKALKDHGEASLEYRAATAAVATAEAHLKEVTAGKVPELTAAQKAQAAYTIIQKDTTLAQGDFARTSSGLANQQRILAAQFTDLKANLGKALLPVVQVVVSHFTHWLEVFQGLSPHTQKMIELGLGLAAVLGPLLIIVGKLASGFGAIGTLLGGGEAALGLGPLLPIALAVGAAAYLIWKNWDKIGPVFQNVMDVVGPIISTLVNGVQGFFSAFSGEGVTSDGFVGFMERIGVAVRAAWEVLQNFIAFLREDVFPVIAQIATYLSTQFGNLVDFFQKIWPSVDEALGHVIAVVQAFIDFVRPIVQAFLGALAALWRAWGDDIWNIVKAVFKTLGEVLNAAFDIVRNIFKFFIDLINGDWGKAWNDLVGIFRGVWDLLFGLLRGVGKVFLSILGGIVSMFAEVFRPVGNFLHTWIVEPFESVMDFIKGLPGRVADYARGMWDGIKHAFVSVINFIIRGWNGIQFKIPGFDLGPIHWGGFTLGLPDIPLLDEGGSSGGPSVYGKGNARMMALGGQTSSGFMAGERGPEWVNLGSHQSAQVFSADTTRRMLAGMATSNNQSSASSRSVVVEAGALHLELTVGAGVDAKAVRAAVEPVVTEVFEDFLHRMEME